MQHVSLERKNDGRSGYRLPYGGPQLVSLVTTAQAEACTTAPLRILGRIGPGEGAPLKLRFSQAATLPSGVTEVACQTDAEVARGALEKPIGDATSGRRGGGPRLSLGAGSDEQRWGDDVCVSVPLRSAKVEKPIAGVSNDRRGRDARLSRLGSQVGVVPRKPCEEVLRRWRFLTEYGEPPPQKRPRVVAELQNSRYPDDALSSADHSRASQSLYALEPSVQPINLQLKYRPVKDAFVTAAWNRLHEHPREVLEDVMRKELLADYHIAEEARARWLRSVLVDVVEWLAARPYAAAYQRHCNRWRERESGPLCVLEDLLIIKKPKNLVGAGVSCPKSFYLNAGHNQAHLAWSMVTEDILVSESRSRLTTFIKAWDRVAAEVWDAPATLSDYMRMYERVVGLLEKGDSYRLRGEYLAAWTARGYLMELVYGKGHMEVVVDEVASLDQFLRVNPDRHDNLRRLQSYFERAYGKGSPSTVRQFLECALGTAAERCNVLTCSMWLCFGDDKGFRDTDFGLSAELWRAAAREHLSAHGVMPHPALVAQSLRQ